MALLTTHAHQGVLLGPYNRTLRGNQKAWGQIAKLCHFRGQPGDCKQPVAFKGTLESAAGLQGLDPQGLHSLPSLS